MATIKLEDMIRRPLVTEKSSVAQQELNAHVFEVDRNASKIQVKQAIEKLFEVQVSKVRTMIMPRKWKRYGRNVGRTKPWKKAIVWIKPGQTLEVLEA